MYQNALLSSEIERTNLNWSKTNRVCRKITSPSDFKIPNVSYWWFFSFDAHFKGKSGPDHFETLKNGFQSSWRLALSAARKFSIGLQQVTCMFASIFGIISIRRNKRECCTTTQSLFKIRNVSCWWFFSFDTHFKGKSGPDHFETLKKWISVVMTLGSECREKIFYWSSASNMYVCKHLWDHIYPQKQTGVLYDNAITF